jgi:hypothetical protein
MDEDIPIDPQLLTKNFIPQPIVIESMVADEKSEDESKGDQDDESDNLVLDSDASVRILQQDFILFDY